jgi:SAM-dependent methyltransferase
VRASHGRARRRRGSLRRADAARAAGGGRRALTTRAIFDEDPELYDRARPGYPDAVFDDLASLAGLVPGSRVLELGPGTGQATVALARRGYAVVAVELGAGLAAFAARRLAAFDAVEIVNVAFEDWALPAAPFDAVVAATSFHWLDPSVRVVKAAEALRPGGALAVIATHHVAGGTAQFFVDVQRCYEAWMPGTPQGLRLPDAAAVPERDRAELEAGGRFVAVRTRRYERDLSYTAREYLDVLRTYSNHRALAPDARDRLLACIGELIDTRFGGRIAKRYLTELTVATTGA